MKSQTILNFIFLIFAFIIYCHAEAPAPPTKLTLSKVDEFIDLNPSTVKFLFRTNPGNKVQLFLGLKPEQLNLIEAKTNDNPNEGIIVRGLTPGLRYYYRINCRLGLDQVESPILSFQKLNQVPSAQTAEWARNSVFYELFVRSFADGDGDGIGDFKGLTQKLPYLSKLGIDAIWLMPPMKSISYHGYDVTDYYQINPDYGTMADFQTMLQAAHQNQLKVIIDLVINHSSHQHPWFQSASSSPNSPYRNFYVWADQTDAIQNGPWSKSPHGTGYYYAMFWDEMPDLNYRNPQVRAEMKKIARFWLDPNGDGNTSDGVDGFRLDATMHIDPNPEVSHSWLQEFNSFVKSINPHAFVVGESWTDAHTIAPFLNDIESSFNFELCRSFLFLAKGREVDLVKRITQISTEYNKYSDHYVDSTLLSNHDINRLASTFNGNLNQLKLAAAIFLTFPGTPFIYYGDELGQKGVKPDPCLRDSMDWYGSGKGPGMTDSKSWLQGNISFNQPNDGISVEEEINDPNSLLTYYQKLIKIRKSNPILFTGTLQPIPMPKGTYGYRINGKANSYIIIVHNIKSFPNQIKVTTGAQELISDQMITQTELRLKPFQTIILKY